MVAVAVEYRAEGQPGRPPVPGFAALRVLPNAAAKSLHGFLRAKIRPGSHILSDGWRGYRQLDSKGFVHTATAISRQKEPAYKLFPWVHITLSNLKRFLLGTHHGVEGKHLAGYVAEFSYRLNRRKMEPDLLPRLPRASLATHIVIYK